MTFGTASFGLRGVIPTPGPVTGDTTQKKRIVMVLSAQELFVKVHCVWNADFVASRTEFSLSMKWLQKGLLVKIRLGFHQLIIDPLQDGIGAVGEGIVQGLLDCVIGVTGRAVDIGDGVADGAGDAGMSRGMINFIEILVVKLAGKEGHGVMTAGAPS